MTGNPARVQGPIAARYVRNTAEPSGEPSKGDVVVVGEVPIAVASAGWTLVRDGLNEVRADEHGTHPLPLPGRAPGSGTAPESGTEDHGE
jgi:hypothetical protein